MAVRPALTHAAFFEQGPDSSYTEPGYDWAAYVEVSDRWWVTGKGNTRDEAREDLIRNVTRHVEEFWAPDRRSFAPDVELISIPGRDDAPEIAGYVAAMSPKRRAEHDRTMALLQDEDTGASA